MYPDRQNQSAVYSMRSKKRDELQARVDAGEGVIHPTVTEYYGFPLFLPNSPKELIQDITTNVSDMFSESAGVVSAKAINRNVLQAQLAHFYTLCTGKPVE